MRPDGGRNRDHVIGRTVTQALSSLPIDIEQHVAPGGKRLLHRLPGRRFGIFTVEVGYRPGTVTRCWPRHKSLGKENVPRGSRRGLDCGGPCPGRAQSSGVGGSVERAGCGCRTILRLAREGGTDGYATTERCRPRFLGTNAMRRVELGEWARTCPTARALDRLAVYTLPFLAEVDRLTTSWAAFKLSRLLDVKWCRPKLVVRVKHLAGSKSLRHAMVRGLAP